MSTTEGKAHGDASRRDAHTRRQGELPDRLQAAGGMIEGAATQVAGETEGSEAAAFGVASFYSLLARPHQKVRVCTGLSCRMKGADDVLAAAEAAGLPVEECSCLAACDLPPAVLKHPSLQ